MQRITLSRRYSSQLKCVLIIVLSLVLVCEWYTHFVFTRVLGVDLYHRLASNINMGDVSRGEIFAHSNTFLPSGSGGCVWDVGANDGVWESNSYYLLQEKNFNGWLFEPDPIVFKKLLRLYGGVGYGGEPSNPRVRLHNFAMSDSTGIAPFRLLPLGLENSLAANGLRQQYDNAEYEYFVATVHGDVLCQQQQQALSSGLCNVLHDSAPSHLRQRSNVAETQKYVTHLTVLSIDAEGEDGRILRAAHGPGCVWDILIVETPSMNIDMIESIGYIYKAKVGYNHVFVKNSSVPDGTHKLWRRGGVGSGNISDWLRPLSLSRKATPPD